MKSSQTDDLNTGTDDEDYRQPRRSGRPKNQKRTRRQAVGKSSQTGNFVKQRPRRKGRPGTSFNVYDENADEGSYGTCPQEDCPFSSEALEKLDFAMRMIGQEPAATEHRTVRLSCGCKYATKMLRKLWRFDVDVPK